MKHPSIPRGTGQFVSASFDDPDADENFADAALHAENNKRERKLWGNLLDDKRLLQTLGYGVWWKNRKRGLIVCGNRIVSRAQLVIMASRERRLLTN